MVINSAKKGGPRPTYTKYFVRSEKQLCIGSQMMDQHYYKLSFYSDIIRMFSKLQKYIYNYNIELIGRYRILKLI